MTRKITITLLVVYWIMIGLATIKSASADELTPEQETRQNSPMTQQVGQSELDHTVTTII